MLSRFSTVLQLAERLSEHMIHASTGTVEDSYNNALTENVNGSYKNELIYGRNWADVVDVEIATFEWVTWWNHTRLHQALDYLSPAEVEEKFWSSHSEQEIIGTKVFT